MNKFYKKLKHLRRKNRLTIEQFAKLVGVNKSTIINWEKGLTSPRIDYLIVICRVLKISVNDLLK